MFPFLIHPALTSLELTETEGEMLLDECDPRSPLSLSPIRDLRHASIPLISLSLSLSASPAAVSEVAILLVRTRSIRNLALGPAYRSRIILSALAAMPHLQELSLRSWSRRRVPMHTLLRVGFRGYPSLAVIAAQVDVLQLIVREMASPYQLERVVVAESSYAPMIPTLLELSTTLRCADVPLLFHVQEGHPPQPNPLLYRQSLYTGSSCLSRLQIHATYRTGILSDALVETIASGLPQLEDFKWESLSPPVTTLMALASMAHHCGRLRILSLPIDVGSTVPKEAAFEPLRMLEVLDATQWQIDARVQQEVIVALSGIGPCPPRPKHWIRVNGGSQQKMTLWGDIEQKVTAALEARDQAEGQSYHVEP